MRRHILGRAGYVGQLEKKKFSVKVVDYILDVAATAMVVAVPVEGVISDLMIFKPSVIGFNEIRCYVRQL